VIYSHLLPHSLIQGIDLVAMIVLTGGIAFRILVSPPSRASRLERSLPFLLIAIGLADLLLRSQMITGRHGSEVVALLPAVLLKTHFGRAWIARTALLIIVAIATATERGAIAAAAGAILLLTASLSGHAADSGDFSLAVLTDWLHLLAVSIWIGGLVQLAFLLRRWIASGELRASSTIAAEVKRFSTLASLSVAVVAATGMFQFWHRVGGVDALLGTNYGQTLGVKLVFVLGLLALGALNRYVLVPKFSSSPEAPRKLFKSVCGEIVLASAILVCAAILLQLPPARNQIESAYQVAAHPEAHMAHGEPQQSRLLPAEGARVKILSPKDGQTFSGEKVPVQFDLVEGKRSGHWHVHVYIDGELMGMFTTPKGSLTGIQPGGHTMEARVVAEDHTTELDAKDAVRFFVQ
jgi:copper resistance protein D